MRSNVLAQILAVKRAELAQPPSTLPQRRRPVRSLAESLARPGARFIMECKRASPSAGVLRELESLHPIVAAYEGIADAISVLTDRTFFGGSLDDLAFVAENASVPILRKDFILEPRQVAESYAYGADAVLLMLSALDDETWTQCARTADQLGVEILTEVHDEAELARAITLGARMIGINNRSFADLSVDLGTTRRLAPQVPDDHLTVCESGIHSHADVRSLASMVDAFLVGSTLMRAPRIDLASRQLVFGEVKVCGLTREQDVIAAWQTGASFGGMVFAETSSRKVTMARARDLVQVTPMPMVGVFVDEAPATIAETAHELGLAAVQLHGAEDDDHIAKTRAALPDGCALWKAVRTGDALPSGVDRILFDAPTAGGGQAFDWSALPRDLHDFGLAGGLHAGNAAAARDTGASLLDVSSGVESAPGVKCAERMGGFFQALRARR